MSKEKPPEMETQIVTAFAPLPPNLRQKLAKVRKAVHAIEKRGQNTFHNYPYAKAEDIQGQVGDAFAEFGIVTLMRNMHIERWEVVSSKGNKENAVEFTCEFGYRDTDSDEEIWYPAIGEARDSGDKAIYKARTGAYKYFLSQSLCLGLGDDPEETGDEEHEHGSTGAKPKQTPYEKHVVDAPKMTPVQLQELRDLVMQTNDPDVTALNICEYFKITELSDLSTLSANVAITRLKMKLATPRAAVRDPLTPNAGEDPEAHANRD